MKKLLLFISLFVIFIASKAQEVKLEGIYQGKNIIVMNPSSCITEIRVNDQVFKDDINANTFEIDFSEYKFSVGEKIKIAIKHKSGCIPKIVNPDVIQAKSTCTFSTIKIDAKTNTLSFTTSGETGSLPFVVEQFRWNKWIKVAEIQGKGTAGQNTYKTVVMPYSGANQFRIKQTDYTKQPKYSKICPFRCMTPPITYSPLKKITEQIAFSDVTMYELYNPYGVLISKGQGNKVDVSGLKKLDKYKYILLFDNQTLQFNKD
jgi:hypothetical protein